ncbi:MAG TPA: DMT family transporter [Pseudonocardia sp.]|jgi:DME family drug/metabolite transporter
MSSRPRPVAVERPRSSSVPLLSVVAAAVLWGTGGLAGALLGRLTDLPPLAVATYRLAGGGLSVLLVLGLLGRLPRLDRAGRVRVPLVGLLSAVYQYCYFASVAATSVGVATLATLGVSPALVLAVESVHRRRRPRAGSLAGVLLAVAGLGLLVGAPGAGGAVGGPAGAVGGPAGGAVAPAGGSLWLGVLYALGAAAGFAAITLLGREPVAGLAGPATIGYGFAAGGALLAVPCVLVTGLGFAPSAAALGVLAYFAWVPTALAYGLFFAGLRGVSASSAAVVAVLEPVTATVLGVLLLGERLGLNGVLGAGLLCVATLVAGLAGARGR